MSIRDDIKTVLISEDQIRERCKELGRQITREYGERNEAPLLVALLRGSVPFLAELMKYIELDIQYDFIDVTSYSGTKSTGDIRILKDLETSAEGKDILLVEDIIDTGRTIYAVKSMFKNKGTKSVRVATLLDKPCRRVMDINAEYVGFEVGDYFVVGYGLDYNQRFRALPYIGIPNEEVCR